MSDLTERLDQALECAVKMTNFDEGVARTTIIALRTLLKEANEEVKRLEAPQWQPIETCPRDENGFLAYEDGSFYKAAFSWEDEEFDRIYYSSDCGQPVVEPSEPSHWMPLPPAPETDE